MKQVPRPRTTAGVLRRLSILMILFSLCIDCAKAQLPTLQWVRASGPPSYPIYSSGQGLRANTSGEVFVTGGFLTGRINFGNFRLTNSTDASALFFVKYDRDGNALWARHMGDPVGAIGQGVAIDPIGNSYICGRVGSNVLLAQYNNAGELQWSRKINASDSNTAGTAVGLDSANNVYLTGYFHRYLDFGTTNLSNNGTTDLSDLEVFVAKFDNAGKLIWVRQAGGQSRDYASGLAVDPQGSCYVTGYFNSTNSVFGPITHTNLTGYLNIFVTKYDCFGNVVWSMSAGHEHGALAYGIDIDTAGNCYVLGTFLQTNLYFGPTNLVSAGSFDIFLAKYSSNGQFLWAKQAGGSFNDIGYGIVVDGEGNSYVTGQFESTASFSVTNLTSKGDPDIFFAKYDSSGNLRWAKQANSDAYDGGSGIALDGLAHIYLTGAFSMTAQFDDTNIVSGSDFQVFVAKYSEAFPPSITTQRQSRVAECSIITTFSVTAAGDEPLSYQWFFNRTMPISGATNSVFAFPAFQIVAGDYSVVVSNRSGLVTSSVATLTVADTTAPVVVLNGLANLSVECHKAFVEPGATATDSCAGVRLVSVIGHVNTNIAGTYTLSYVASDLSGNSATNTRIVTVVDTTPPLVTLNGPASMIVECHSGFADPGAIAIDVCAGAVPVEVSGFVDANTPGTYTLRYVATEPFGNSTTNMRVVTVLDTIPPALIGQGTNMAVSCPATPVFTAPRVIDNCDPNPTMTFTDATVPGRCPGAYAITRTWVAKDECGNISAPVSQSITVHDVTPPRLGPVPVGATIECNGLPPILAILAATDDCDPNPTITFTDVFTAGRCPQNYSLTRTWMAVDACGNAASNSQIIIVRDTTAPVLSGQGASAVIQCPATPLFIPPRAIDNCDPDPMITFTDITTPGARAANYTVTRKWVAKDQCGNISAPVSQTITVQDIAPPEIICPTNLVIEATGQTGTVVHFTVTATDHCDGGVMAKCVPESGSRFPIGTVAVTCRASDSSGNSDSCSFRITVLHSNVPPACLARLLPSACVLIFPNDPRFYVVALNGSNACIILDGSQSSDADNDALQFSWKVDGTKHWKGETVTNCLDLGCHQAVLALSDGREISSCTLDVCVITACEAVEQCIALLDGAASSRQNKGPLVATLKAACASFDRDNFTSGLNQLAAFQNKVHAQLGRTDPASTQAIVDCAQRILDAVGCQGHR
jgi:hypothetical protein